MSVVRINALNVPEPAREAFEARFASRAGMVEGAEGFEHFELLRPVDGGDRYLVYTRWRTEEDFTRWTESQAFGAGHRQAEESRQGQGDGQGHAAPAAAHSEIWAFDVLQTAEPVAAETA
jgi:heme-degrading monooxygenase HmoA